MPAPQYDLNKRTVSFAKRVRSSLREFDWDPISWSDVQQVLRSSGSIAANYIEAREGLSENDYSYRIKVCRKEAKETALWLYLISTTTPLLPETLRTDFKDLQSESTELVKIFQAILNKRKPT